MNVSSTIRRLATLVAVVATAALAAGAPAQASVTNVNGTTTATAACDFGYHRLYLSGNFQLSSRYPNGAWIESRYARWTVDSLGRATSAVAYTPFTVSRALPGTVSWNTSLSEGIAAQFTSLPTVTIGNIGGQLKVAVQVAVHNGSAWEFGNFDTQTWYSNIYLNTPFESDRSCAG